MTINEYRKAFLDLVEKLEKEHSCTVDSIEIKNTKSSEFPYFERKDIKFVII